MRQQTGPRGNAMTIAIERAQPRFQKATMSILFAVSLGHLLNDIMQSLVGTRYTHVKENKNK